MRYRISIRPLKSLSLKQFRRCWQLCEDCEDYAYTRWALKRWLAGIYEKRWVVLAQDPEGTIVGWALATDIGEEAVDFKIYVDKDYRRRGIGEAITKAAEQKWEWLNVYTPTAGARKFYARTLPRTRSTKGRKVR